MSRRTIITAVAACLVVAYIFVVVPVTIKAERNDTFSGLSIKINDPNGTGFLKESDIREIVESYCVNFDSLRRKDLNTLALQKMLNTNNRVENSTCNILNDGTLAINIDPINPVARVFDSKGSVYINAVGKRVPARPSFHIDVPVVTTDLVADSAMMQKLLPVLRSIKENSLANALVSSLRIDKRGDIIIIPNVVGHVINFGDTTLIDNKFDRLSIFYHKVMPVRGWDAFDTISVKWDGRVIATKRDKSAQPRINLEDLNLVEEILPDEIMMTD